MVHYTCSSLLIQATRVVDILAVFLLFGTVSSESDAGFQYINLETDKFGNAPPRRLLQAAVYSGERTSAGQIFLKLLPWIIISILLCIILPWLYKKWKQSQDGSGGWTHQWNNNYQQEKPENQSQWQSASYDNTPEAGAGPVVTDADSDRGPGQNSPAAASPRRQQQQRRGQRRGMNPGGTRTGSPASLNQWGGDETPNAAWPSSSPISANNYGGDETPNVAWPTGSPDASPSSQNSEKSTRKGATKAGRIPNSFVEKRGQ